MGTERVHCGASHRWGQHHSTRQTVHRSPAFTGVLLVKPPPRGEAQSGYISLTLSCDPTYSPRSQPSVNTGPCPRPIPAQGGIERLQRADLDRNRAPPRANPVGSPSHPGLPQLCPGDAHSRLQARSLRGEGQAGKWAPGTALDGWAVPPPQLAPGGRSCTWVVGPQGGAGPPSRLCQVPPTGCSPQRGPWGLSPATPAPCQACQALQSSGSGLVPSSCGSLALWDRKDTLCPHVGRPTCAHRLGSEITRPPLHARRCSPELALSPPDPTMAWRGWLRNCPYPPSACVQTLGEAPGTQLRACLLGAHFTNVDTEALSSPGWHKVTQLDSNPGQTLPL